MFLFFLFILFITVSFGTVFFLLPDDHVDESNADIFQDSLATRGEDVQSNDSPLVSYLKGKCCAIPIFDTEGITILSSPKEFFDTLKQMIRSAKFKISISALYIGDGNLSKDLVGCLEERVKGKIEEMKREAIVDPLHIELVLDFNRMSDRKNLLTLRPLLNLAHDAHTLYQTMYQKTQKDGTNPVSVRLFLFQTPSELNRYLPPNIFGRAKEILGVQHTKILSFDEKDCIVTGANLSDDYFETRMDRYMVAMNCRGLGKWFSEAVATLAHQSYEIVTEHHISVKVAEGTIKGYQLQSTDNVSEVRSTNKICMPLMSYHPHSQLFILHNGLGVDPTNETSAFVAKSKAAWLEFIQRVANMPECRVGGDLGHNCEGNQVKAWLFPTLQFGRVLLYHDSILVEKLIDPIIDEEVKYFHTKQMGSHPGDDLRHARMYFTSPYMNVYPDLIRQIRKSDKCMVFDFITASIRTNGWKGHRGFAGMIPSFYLQLMRSFFYLMDVLKMSARVTIHEFTKEGMTFHSKGFWVTTEAASVENEDVKGSTTNTTADHEDASLPHLNKSEAYGEMPFLAAYGSTNYGHRSVHKDVECEVIMYTRDPSLQEKINKELCLLRDNSTRVSICNFTDGADGRFQPVVATVAHCGHRFL